MRQGLKDWQLVVILQVVGIIIVLSIILLTNVPERLQNLLITGY